MPVGGQQRKEFHSFVNTPLLSCPVQTHTLPHTAPSKDPLVMRSTITHAGTLWTQAVLLDFHETLGGKTSEETSPGDKGSQHRWLKGGHNNLERALRQGVWMR